MIQATCWIAQLSDRTKMRGGQTNLYPDDVNVSAVPLERIAVFTIAHNTFSDTYHAPSKTWYRNGKPWTNRETTVEYIMQDETILTVTQLSAGRLELTQK